nr:hypothetical protein [Nitrococcus mobilis]
MRLGALHFGLARLFKKTVSAGRIARRIAVYGAGCESEEVLKSLQAEAPLLRVEGVYDERSTRILGTVYGREVSGGIKRLIDDILERKIDLVLLALPMAGEQRLQGIERMLEQVAVEVRLVPPAHWFGFGKKSVRTVGRIPTLGLWEPPFRVSGALLKWCVDKSVAISALLALSPLLALIAAAIKLESRGAALSGPVLRRRLRDRRMARHLHREPTRPAAR